MQLYTPNQAAHYYTLGGLPRHTNSNGKPTTLRDARKENLLPSVTTIMKIMAKPQVEAWEIEQAILASVTLPRKPDEAADAFAGRIVADMDRVCEHARQFGDALHNGIEHINRTGELPPAMSPIAVAYPRLIEWLKKYLEWFKDSIAKVYSCESVIVHGNAGYAGRVDLHAHHYGYGDCVIDFKSQRVRKRVEFYDDWIYQLSAYQQKLPGTKCLSVAIPSNEPSAPVEKLWTDTEAKEGWEVFQCLLNLWQKVKGYKPNEQSFAE